MLRINPAEYRGERGFLVSGKDTIGRAVSIFCRTERTAKLIRDAVRYGRSDRVAVLISEERAGP